MESTSRSINLFLNRLRRESQNYIAALEKVRTVFQNGRIYEKYDAFFIRSYMRRAGKKYKDCVHLKSPPFGTFTPRCNSCNNVNGLATIRACAVA